MLKIFITLLQSNESVDKFNWICGWIQMNSLMIFNEFVDEFLLIHWGILVNSLRNSSEFQCTNKYSNIFEYYVRIKSSPQSSHFILQNKESGQSCFVMSYHDTTHQQNASKYKNKNKNK